MDEKPDNHYCKECSEIIFPTKIGQTKSCHHYTTNSDHEFCHACALEIKACMACGKPIEQMCQSCAKILFVQVGGVGTKCGHWSPCVEWMWCKRCAAATGVCKACSEQL